MKIIFYILSVGLFTVYVIKYILYNDELFYTIYISNTYEIYLKNYRTLKIIYKHDCIFCNLDR